MRIEPPTPAAIAEAGEAIRRGKLIVMPTETVYGLAADALNSQAVQAIFAAKGRPSDNPLIVHVAEVSDLPELVSNIPDYAIRLIEEYWPGPLTLVLPKKPNVPDVVTAGLDTVAVRMPAHPIAWALIRESGRVLAAPSANRFMSLSPTQADHVSPEIGEHVAMVLDGGPCEIGLESTVLDCTGPAPRILRPGKVTRAEIEGLLGVSVATGIAEVRRSPGLYPRHYAPKTPVRIVDQLGPTEVGLVFGEGGEGRISMPSEPVAYGAALYRALYELDQRSLSAIYVEKPPETPEWEAVWDRLKKAATS